MKYLMSTMCDNTLAQEWGKYAITHDRSSALNIFYLILACLHCNTYTTNLYRLTSKEHIAKMQRVGQQERKAHHGYLHTNHSDVQVRSACRGT